MHSRVVIGFLAVCIAVLSVVVSSPRRQTAHAAPEAPRIAVDYGKIALDFEANRGQTDPRVRFLARSAGYVVFLTDDEAVVALEGEGRSQESVRMTMTGARADRSVRGSDPRTARSHYYRGQDQSAWIRDVEHYAAVESPDVYPGIDLVYHARGRQLEYDFVVAPEADPREIRLRFAGPREVRVNAAGALELQLAAGVLTQHAPEAYQEVDGGRRVVPAKYVLRGEDVAMELGRYDTTLPLVIDPVISYATYLGGSSSEHGNGIAVDAQGQVVVVGETSSFDFPVASAIQPTKAQPGEIVSDVFITKLTAQGDGVVFSTYLGGGATFSSTMSSNGEDRGNAVAIDGEGGIYVTGMTSSGEFPVRDAYQPQPQWCGFHWLQAPFVSKLDASGGLVYSTYLGSCGAGNSIGVDDSGQAVVVGTTNSNTFPTVNAYQATHSGSFDAFVAKLNAAGNALVYSTYFGGADVENGHDVAVDASGTATIVGGTLSGDFPLRNAYQSTWRHVPDNVHTADAFVGRLDPTGGLVYSTYLGGSLGDSARAVALDGAGSAYVVGSTESYDFPVMNAAQPLWAGSTQKPDDGFAAKLSPDGRSLVYSTYLGGPVTEWAEGVAVDAGGRAWVMGHTFGPTGTTMYPRGTSDARQRTWVVGLSPAGSAVLDAWLFHPATGLAPAMAIDAAGAVYLAGPVESRDLPATSGAFQTSQGGTRDAFVMKAAPGGAPEPTPTPMPMASAGRLEETDPAVEHLTEADTWFPNHSSQHSGGSIKGTVTAGAWVRVPFRGTGIRWYAYTDEWSGIADVFIDGRWRQAVDTYASPARAQALVFEATGLVEGGHSLLIYVKGTRNASSANSWIWLDAFEIVNGGSTPTATPTGTASATPTMTAMPTSTAPPTATPTPTGAPTATPTPAPRATPGRVEQDSAMVAYAGNWYTNPHSVHSGGSAVLAMDAGDRATFTFNGTRARWIGYRDEWSGIARVSIDGVVQASVDTYQTPQAADVVLFQTPTLANGTHTLTVEATGTRGASSGGAWIWIDAFEWEGGSGTPAPTPTPTPTGIPTATASPTPTVPPTATPTPGQPTTLEETAATFDGNWYPNTHPVHSGGRAVIAVDAGSRATLTFTGTGATWIGYADEWSGIARVYVDGALRATVDTYATPFQARKRLYTVSGLAAGTHTLAVEATATANSSSGGGGIWVDGFEVTP